MKTISHKISRISFFLCATLMLYCGAFFYPRWQQSYNEAQISWDAGGYYWYLPSAFIYHDLKGQGFKDSIMQKYQPSPPNDFQYGYIESSGNYVIRYTMGTALMEAPFFFIAHVVAKPLGFPADGFSQPYQFMIWLGGMLLAFIALWYLRRLLLCYYPDTVVGITLLLLVFGTNYLNYATIDTGMTHTWLFSLYVFLLWNTHHYYLTGKRKYALGIGFLVGMLGLIRPPELISAIIPVLWGMERILVAAFKERLQFFARQWKPLLLAVFICLSLLFLQGLYWHYATGKWLVYTYRDQGFVWRDPFLKLYAFNYQCGWLRYTPMMVLAIIGLLPFVFRGKNRIAIICLIAINYYVVASWKAWDYGGRAMIQNYPALLFPLASLLQFLLKNKWRTVIAAPVLLLLTYFNLWWTYQAHKGTLIGSVPATKAYYWATILRYNLPPEIQKLRDNEDLYRGTIKKPQLLYSNPLNTADTASRTVVNERELSYSFAVKSSAYDWIRAGATIHIDQKEWNVWYMTQFILRLKKGDQVIQENSLRLQRFLEPGDAKQITVDAKVRSRDYDHIELLFRNDNKGTLPAVISKLEVYGFNE